MYKYFNLLLTLGFYVEITSKRFYRNIESFQANRDKMSERHGELLRDIPDIAKTGISREKMSINATSPVSVSILRPEISRIPLKVYFLMYGEEKLFISFCVDLCKSI